MITQGCIRQKSLQRAGFDRPPLFDQDIPQPFLNHSALVQLIDRVFEFFETYLAHLFLGIRPSRTRSFALSLGFYGVKNGLLGVASGGATIKRGPGGMLEDNNDFALALVMNVPLPNAGCPAPQSVRGLRESL